MKVARSAASSAGKKSSVGSVPDSTFNILCRVIKPVLQSLTGVDEARDALMELASSCRFDEFANAVLQISLIFFYWSGPLMAMAIRLEREEIARTDHHKRHADDSRLTHSDRFLFFMQHFLSSHSSSYQNSLAIHLINSLIPFCAVSSATIRQRAVSLIGHVVASLADDEESDALDAAVEACEVNLVPRLHDSAPAVRAEAVYALRRLQRGAKDCEVTAHYLYLIAMEQNKLVRRTVATTISLSSMTATRGIARLASDTDDGIRLLLWRKLSAAKRSLKNIPPLIFAEMVAKGLADSAVRVRNATSAALLQWFKHAQEDPTVLLQNFGLGKVASLTFSTPSQEVDYFTNIDTIATEVGKFVLEKWIRGVRACSPGDLSAEECAMITPAFCAESECPTLEAAVLHCAIAKSASERDVESAAFVLFRDTSRYAALVEALLAEYSKSKDRTALLSCEYTLRTLTLGDFADVCVQRLAVQCAASVLRRTDFPSAEFLVKDAMRVIIAVQASRHDVVHNPYRNTDSPVGAVVSTLMALLEPSQVYDVGPSPSLLSPLAAQGGAAARDGDLEDRIFSFAKAVVAADEAGSDDALDTAEVLWARGQTILAEWFNGPRSTAAVANDDLLSRAGKALLSSGESDSSKFLGLLGESAMVASVRCAVPVANRVPRIAKELLEVLVSLVTGDATEDAVRAAAVEGSMKIICSASSRHIGIDALRQALGELVRYIAPDEGVSADTTKAAAAGFSKLLATRLDLFGEKLAVRALAQLMLQYATAATSNEGSAVNADALRVVTADTTQPVVTAWTRAFLQPFAEADRDRRSVVVAAAGDALRSAVVDSERYSLPSLLDAITGATRARCSAEAEQQRGRGAEAALASACVHEYLFEWYVCEGVRVYQAAKSFAEAGAAKGLSSRGKAKAKAKTQTLLQYAYALATAVAKLETHRFSAIVKMAKSSRAKASEKLETLLADAAVAETVRSGARSVVIGNTFASMLLTPFMDAAVPTAPATKAATALVSRLKDLLPLTQHATAEGTTTKLSYGDLTSVAQKAVDTFLQAADATSPFEVNVRAFDGSIVEGARKGGVRRVRGGAAAAAAAASVPAAVDVKNSPKSTPKSSPARTAKGTPPTSSDRVIDDSDSS